MKKKRTGTVPANPAAASRPRRALQHAGLPALPRPDTPFVCREQAARLIRARTTPAPRAPDALSPQAAQRLLRELRVYRGELEMQNEELRRAQAETELIGTRYFDLYDLAPVGYFTLSKKGLILEANLTAARLLGVARKQLIGRSLPLFILPEDQAIYYRHRKPLFETGAPQVCELRLVRSAGGSFWARLDAVGMRDKASGTPVCCVAMSDITERKRAETQIRDFSRRLLAVREEEKRQLSAVLHHDVGSMTVGVASRLQAMEGHCRAGRIREAQAALKSCRKLFSQSVKGLQELAVGLRPPDLDILGLPAAIRQYIVGVTHETSLRIHFTDASRGARLTSESQTILFRIAQESLNNVVKYAGAKRVQAHLSAGKRGVALSIADDGRGFRPDRQPMPSGAGMGIVAMREMAASLGGTLEIESKAGKRTRVRVNLPLAKVF